MRDFSFYNKVFSFGQRVKLFSKSLRGWSFRYAELLAHATWVWGSAPRF